MLILLLQKSCTSLRSIAGFTQIKEHCSRLMAIIKASNYDDRVSLLPSLTSLALDIVDS